MNKDILEGNWKQLKGHVREMWGPTDDELISCGRIDLLECCK
jgi:uncharacterized protein YjbJ (UPF0337 family)